VFIRLRTSAFVLNARLNQEGKVH